MNAVLVSAEVATALAERRPVVALESTIFSKLGLPSPANAEALERCTAAVRDRNAVPAITAVVDGVARVGLEPEEHDRVLTGSEKVAARDLPVRGRTEVAVRRDDGVGSPHPRCPCRCRGVRDGWHRRCAPRGRELGRHQRRPRCARGASSRHGLRGGQGVSGPRPNSRAPRDRRCPGARLRNRRSPRLLDAFDRHPASSSGGDSSRSGGDRRRRVGARLPRRRPRDRPHPRSRRASLGSDRARRSREPRRPRPATA